MYEKAVCHARTNLSERARALDEAEFSSVFEFTASTKQLADLYEVRSRVPGKWLRERLGPCSGNRCFYKISVEDRLERAKLQAEFHVAQGTERSYELPQLNKTIWDSPVLYVGTSRDIVKRLKDHLFRAPGKTFAMNLGLWAEDISAQVKVEAFYVKSSQAEMLAADIENSLWDIEKPCLGKRGGK